MKGSDFVGAFDGFSDIESVIGGRVYHGELVVDDGRVVLVFDSEGLAGGEVDCGDSGDGWFGVVFPVWGKGEGDVFEFGIDGYDIEWGSSGLISVEEVEGVLDEVGFFEGELVGDVEYGLVEVSGTVNDFADQGLVCHRELSPIVTWILQVPVPQFMCL